MSLPTVPASPEALQDLPVPAPRLDPRDVVVPDRYSVEVVLAGPPMPIGMGIDDDGTVYVCEGGSTWPTQSHLPGRILRLRPDGRPDVLGEELLAGPRHISPSPTEPPMSRPRAATSAGSWATTGASAVDGLLVFGSVLVLAAVPALIGSLRRQHAPAASDQRRP